MTKSQTLNHESKKKSKRSKKNKKEHKTKNKEENETKIKPQDIKNKQKKHKNGFDSQLSMTALHTTQHLIKLNIH